MANDETKKHLLTTLTESRIGSMPARRDERVPEPSEPVEISREEEGRSPEEVLGEREVSRPASPEEVEKSKQKKWKVRIDDGSGEPVVQELTVEQLAEKGLLDKLITTANQFPTVQRKYQDLLEQAAGRGTEKAVATRPARPQPPTAAQILDIYAAVAQIDVKGGYIEPDFVEAYPQLSAQLMYWRDIIESLAERMGLLNEWRKGEIQAQNVAMVANLLDETIEAVAKKGDGDKGDPLFKDLRDPAVRDQFVAWLRSELDPKIGKLTAENMEKFWFAFNAEGILDLTKKVVKKAAESPPLNPNRRAASDGSSARLGMRESPKEKTLLERMSDDRLGSEA